MPHPLSTTSLTVGYTLSRGEIHRVLSDVNVHLNHGEVVAFFGANGVGKSTLLRTLGGVQPPLVGTVMLSGSELEWLSEKELARKVAFVYTDRPGAGGLTVEELTSLGRYPYTGIFGLLSDDDRCIVSEAMDAVGISHKAGCMCSDLSDGERQKAMIARALAQDTPIIILDEPTAFLDVASRIEILQLLSSLAHTHGKSVLLSSHDIGATITVADRLWLALPGQHTVVEGKTASLLDSPYIDLLYPGRAVRFDRTLRDFTAIKD